MGAGENINRKSVAGLGSTHGYGRITFLMVSEYSAIIVTFLLVCMAIALITLMSFLHHADNY